MHRINFCYVDYWHGTGSWRRIKINEIEDRAKKQKFYNVYTSVQRFSTPQHLDNELCWGPLFFDLDSADNIELAKEDAKKLFIFFSQFGINKEFIHTFFSGSKGFHILIEPEVFGISPHPELAYIMKQIALFLKDFLKISTIDIQAYSIRRLLRLQDSLHPRSGKYKIELDIHELDQPIKKIIETAKAPRGNLYDVVEYSGMEPQKIAKDWWNGFVEQYLNREVLHKLKPRNIINKIDKYPMCVSFLLSQVALPINNTGNKSVLSLAAYFKDFGKTEDETISIITEWLLKVSNCGEAKHPDKLKSMIISTVKYIYEPKISDNYHFACSFIRALGSNETKIPCEYEKCELISSETDQEPETPIILHLSEASKAEYKDHKLSIKCMIAGKDGTPYIIPKEVSASCIIKEKKVEMCGSCVLKNRDRDESYIYEFTAKDCEVLEFIDASRDYIIGAVRRKLNCDKCRYCRVVVKAYTNMETIRVVPLVSVEDNKYGAQQHVTRVCYFLGHGIQLNEKYKIIAYTYAHPRDQHATHLISELEPYSSSLSNFKMTTALHKELSVFKLREKQSVMDKFEEIHNDLEANVYKIWHRRAMAISIDLIYHSVVSFPLQNQQLQRGWCEVLIVGDSGQGKTQMIERLNSHYKLGEGSSGESSKRTGLLYNFQETANNWMLQWGRIPLNDRGLFYIDEFGALSPEEIGQMSYMRSTGKIMLRGICTDETNARTRLIFMTNPRNGRSLNSFNHGVESILGIIPAVEDIRRLDFAVTVASGEVPLESLNRTLLPVVEHVYTSYLCEQLILWAWSRRSDEIVILPETEKEILAKSIEMSKIYFARIPLVEPADQRIKIARLSVATAARVFSCDEKGVKIIVKPEHVNFVYEFVRKCYDSPSMGYDIYSGEERSKSEITPNQEVALKQEFSTFRDAGRLKEVLLRMTYVSRGLLEDMLGYSRDQSKDILKFLMVNNLIEHRRNGFVKNPHFISFLKSLNEMDLMSQQQAYHYGEKSLI